MYSLLIIGKGLTTKKRNCATMNLHFIRKLTFRRQERKILNASEATAKTSLNTAVNKRIWTPNLQNEAWTCDPQKSVSTRFVYSLQIKGKDFTVEKKNCATMNRPFMSKLSYRQQQKENSSCCWIRFKKFHEHNCKRDHFNKRSAEWSNMMGICWWYLATSRVFFTEWC